MLDSDQPPERAPDDSAMALARWCDQVVREDGSLPLDVDFAYSLLHQFGDLRLARAGVLHAIDPDALPRVLPHWLIGDVLPVLEERHRLVSIDPRAPGTVPSLLFGALPRLADSRSAHLVVAAAARAVNTDGCFSVWLRAVQLGANDAAREGAPTPLNVAVADLDLVRAVISPIARSFGLWRERALVEDAALRDTAPQRFAAMVAFALDSAVADGPCAARVAAVRDALCELPDVDPSAVRWEWRHLSSLHHRLPDPMPPAHGAWSDREAGCGFVAVLVADDAACYRALRRLHQCFGYVERGKLRDYLHQPTPSGYRSLRTTVWVPDPHAGGEHAGSRGTWLQVRLTPADAGERRFALGGSGALSRLDSVANIARAEPIAVTAADGRMVTLPAGATVLNFAYSIHKHFLVFAEGAQVNNRRVSLLHRLSPGDSVVLDLGASPRPLPRGWEAHVPPPSIITIKREWRRYYAEELLARGRRRVRAELRRREHTDISDARLDSLLRAASRTLGARIPDATPPVERWLLRQIGLVDAFESGENFETDLQTDEHVVDAVVRNIAQGIEVRALLQSLGAPVPPDDADARVELCAVCGPDPDAAHVVATLRGGGVVLHCSAVACPVAAGGIAVTRHRGRVDARYVVLEVRDRQGLAADVLGAIAGHGVGISEVVGLRLGAGRGLMRMRMDPIDDADNTALLIKLRRLSGVATVRGPADPVLLDEKELMPPRYYGGQRTSVLPTPYVTGSVITDDARFYGMAPELATLYARVEQAAGPDATGGARIFVTAPLKSGKSSLAEACFRLLQRDSVMPYVAARCASTSDESWGQYAARLTQRLVSVARTRAAGVFLAEDLERWPLADAVHELRARLRCTVVLAVDEAVQLLRNAERSDKDLAEIDAFRGFIDATPGVVLIWVGPFAPVRWLGRTASRVLQSSDLVRLQPAADESTVASLLRAERAGPRYNIQAPDKLAHQLWRVSGGNLYWASLLAQHMWMGAVESSARTAVVRYSIGALGVAERELVRDGLPFHDRYLVSTWTPRERRAARLILEALATLPSSMAGGGGGLGVRALAERVHAAAEDQRVRRPPTREDVERLVDRLLVDLEHRGAIRAALGASEAAAWQISAPILANHIRYLMSIRRDWNAPAEGG